MPRLSESVSQLSVSTAYRYAGGPRRALQSSWYIATFRLNMSVAPAMRPARRPKRTVCASAMGADNLEIGLSEQRPKAPPLSGVQHKLALSSARNGQCYCVPVKGTLSDLIAKLPVKGDDSQVFNEYACMQLAALAGVNIAQCRMVPMREMARRPELVEALGADTHFLGGDRFDRGPSSAVHMEDAC